MTMMRKKKNKKPWLNAQCNNNARFANNVLQNPHLSSFKKTVSNLDSNPIQITLIKSN